MLQQWIGSVLFATLAVSFSLNAAGYKRYHEGNSLTGGVAGIFSEVAHDAGFTDDSWDGYIRAGQPLDFGWYGGQEIIEQAMRDDGPWDFIQVQPFNRRYAVDEADAARKIFETALKYNPNCTLMVYITWRGNPGTRYESLTEWEADMHSYINDQCERIVDYNERFLPDAPIFVVPSAPALLALNDSIKAGKVPGFSSIAELYNDGIHMNANGNYFNACVHFASYYQQSPVGFSHEYNVDIAIYNQDVSLTDEQALIFQKTAWDVVRNYRRTLVSREPKVRPDTEAPTEVTEVSVTPKKNELEISWSPSTDNVGVAEYLMYVNDNWFGSSESSPKTVQNDAAPGPEIQPGTTYDVYIRARDAEYNLSAPSETVTVTTPETVKGDKGKFDFGTGESPVATDYTEVLVTEAYDAQKGYGYNPPTTTKRSKEDTENANSLLRDKHSYYSKMNFRYDTPDGDYRVMFWLQGDSVDVYAGDSLMIDGATAPSGEYLIDSMDVTVTDGYIKFEFNDQGGPGLNWFSLAGLEIKPLGGTGVDTKLAAKVNRTNKLTWNPINRTFTVTLPVHKIVRQEIIDLQGKVLFKVLGNNVHRIRLPENRPSGIYIFRVYHAGGIIGKRFYID